MFTVFGFLTIFAFSTVLSNDLHDYAKEIPKPSEKALMGRYIIHNVDWVSIATISTLDDIKNYPFANLKSVADGPANNGTGVPYLLMTDLDLSGRDVKSNNKVTLLAALAETSYCKDEKFDPQDPRCGRVILSGKLVKLSPDTDEYKFARNALITKHPVINIWVNVHTFYFAKIILEQVCVLDYFGGATFVPVKEYLDVKPDSYGYFTRVLRENDISASLVTN